LCNKESYATIDARLEQPHFKTKNMWCGREQVHVTVSAVLAKIAMLKNFREKREATHLSIHDISEENSMYNYGASTPGYIDEI
jgi:hypothetical protein